MSSHPLFPAAIAVWFATLFGMASMVLRAQTLEGAVRALHIDLVVPAAAPPLGFTARLLIALLFALFGAALGFLLARVVVARGAGRGGRAQTSRTKPSPAKSARGKSARGKSRRAQPDPAAATADDNDDLARLDAAREAAPVRRRGLGGLTATAPDSAPGEDPYAAVPGSLPGPSILNLGDLEAVEPLMPPPPLPPVADDLPPPFATPEWRAPEPAVPSGRQDWPARSEALPEAHPEPLPEPLSAPFAATGPAHEDKPADIADPIVVSPFGPRALAAALEAARGGSALLAAAEPEVILSFPAPPAPPVTADASAHPADRVEPAATLPQDLPPEPAASTPRRLVPRAGNAAQILREAPLESLGVVELVERFALALAARADRDAARAEAQAEPTPATARAVEPAANPFAAPRVAPAPAPTASPAPRPALIRAPAPELAAPPPFAAPAQSAPAKSAPGRPFDVPEMLRSPLPGGNVEWFDDEDEADHALASLLPPRLSDERSGFPAATADVTAHDHGHEAGFGEFGSADGPFEDDAEDDEAPGDRFSSLLSMKPSIRPRPAEDAPAPVRLAGGGQLADGQPGDPAVTEEALRNALAALQRMSGAA
ncbi:hypothetical protein [Novosphingobium aerophilum]|uniref:Uncharacterized protein n=1 Tax=Novosphingobium aerophilum TaxID=2839843 RepID=A0A7X1F9A7_9SPHN|nr:hypothetical protein [Novosphingobium aerophilum]MBC2652726.1 hypothetical protein [Novosphingobium aerophilum]